MHDSLAVAAGLFVESPKFSGSSSSLALKVTYWKDSAGSCNILSSTYSAL